MVVSVTLDYEFYEVLNAFPVLTSFFSKDLNLDLSKMMEGESVDEFFDKCELSTFEKGVVLRQVNKRLKEFFSSSCKFFTCEDSVEEESFEEE